MSYRHQSLRFIYNARVCSVGHTGTRCIFGGRTELNEVSVTGIKFRTDLAEVSSTGIEVAPNLPSCQVPVFS